MNAFSQTTTAGIQVVDVYLGDFCLEEQQIQAQKNLCPYACKDKKIEGTQPLNTSSNINDLLPVFGPIQPISLNQEKLEFCKDLATVSLNQKEPYEHTVIDDQGEPWKIRFHFGFTRTAYLPTDMRLESSRVNVTIKDFEFDERTSAEYYNPKNWVQFQDAFRWIDEPTNTYKITFAKDKDEFFISVFHPKFLKTRYQTKFVTGSVDGVEHNEAIPINEEFDGYNNQQGEMYLVRFENTHRQMDWQIGYGRKIVLMDHNKAGKLTYTPHIEVGATTGRHLTVYTKPNEYWEFDDFYKEKDEFQGFNISVGHRLEYQPGKDGKVSLFIDQKFTHSSLNHQFMDGAATYKMNYMPVTVGVDFDIYKFKPKKTFP